MRVTYLGHSGFMVEKGNRVLLFDCIAQRNNVPGTGEVEHGEMPELDPEKQITVFISHLHPDHYVRRIWKLVQEYPKVEYFIGNDISEEEIRNDVPAEKFSCVCRTGPDECYEGSGGMKVETLRSTDEGVAFFVTLEDGTTIFHAGDLLLWMWDENTPEEDEFFRAAFFRELERIRGRRADIAFLPLDPRLGDRQALSIDEYLKNLDVKFALPMHFWRRYDVVSEYVKSAKDYPFRAPVHLLTHENESFEL